MSFLTRKPDLKLCPICYDNFFEEGAKVRTVVGLGCEHHFHVDCISSYLYKRVEAQPPCPTCRTPISEDMQTNIKSIDDKDEFEEVVGNTTNFYAGCTKRLVRSLWTVELDNKILAYLFKEPEGNQYIQREITDSIYLDRRYKYSINNTTNKFNFVNWVKTNGFGGETFYEGERDKEHKVLTIAGGVQTFYEGERGKVKTLSGSVQTFYEGERDEECKVRTLCLGVETFFRGSKGNEYKLQINRVNGDIETYLGLKDNECLHRINRANGEVETYTCTTGLWRNKGELCEVVRVNGDHEEFHGRKGEERKWRTTLNNGDVLQFHGGKGHEYKWLRILLNGDKDYYSERQELVSKKLRNGDVEFYKGAPGAEFLTDKTFANGDKHKFLHFSGERSFLVHTKIKETGIQEFYNECVLNPYRKCIHYPDGTIENFEPTGRSGSIRMTSRSKISLQQVLETEYFTKNGMTSKKKKRIVLVDTEYGLEEDSKRRLVADAFVNKPKEAAQSMAIIVRPTQSASVALLAH